MKALGQKSKTSTASITARNWSTLQSLAGAPSKGRSKAQKISKALAKWHSVLQTNYSIRSSQPPIAASNLQLHSSLRSDNRK
ncbi:hypothetical protein Nepgr_022949 [Nepenthes gracilis]|uniref:Uncharacterized protein n=1 Tax=Nepenthes gracilis TaxID=150966 RepID=A0AAD3T300_NEPGR|nr:hypothetical protein Nepgr_022949 [Nepenthes gracilis]